MFSQALSDSVELYSFLDIKRQSGNFISNFYYFCMLSMNIPKTITFFYVMMNSSSSNINKRLSGGDKDPYIMITDTICYIRKVKQEFLFSQYNSKVRNMVNRRLISQIFIV